MELTMLQDLIIAVFNMLNMTKEKDILDQYTESSMVLHEMMLTKLGKEPDYYIRFVTKEQHETNNY